MLLNVTFAPKKIYLFVCLIVLMKRFSLVKMKNNKEVTIIDYGAGNLRSVVNAISNLGYYPKLTSNQYEVLEAPVVIFPGVGAAFGGFG